MKKYLQITTSTLLVASLILINGCKKGKDGAPGKDGSSNVTSHTFSTNSWLSNPSRYFQNFPIAEITSSNINSISVAVYFSTTSGVWIALPYTYVTTPNNYFMGFNTSAGLVQVTWDCNSTVSIGSDPNAIFSTTVQIKIVTIPPSARKANPNLDWNNYSEVKQKLNLKD
ncbi:MAG TPA: hypothetical protein VN026_07680 [Bacteroidia bacterium]|jgi:hypothetical protein|nr:hypothetical protein [Bacteroidia bacterium]